MPFIWIFLGELFFLAMLTTHSTSYFLKLFYSMTKSEKASIWLFSLLFFPGTLVHEIAHWLMAKILFVRTSSMEFVPQMQGDVIKMGSVSIAKTDPVRRLLIGVAPVLVGLSIVIAGIWVLQGYTSQLVWWEWILAGYLVFVVASTMFSSRKDLEGNISVFITIIAMGVIFYLLGFDWVLQSMYTYITINLNEFFRKLSYLMIVPLGINIVIGVLEWTGRKKL